jgi:L-aspartate oxidase
VGDGSGQAIISGLINTLKNYPNVTFVKNATAVDLITFPHHSRDPLAAYQPIDVMEPIFLIGRSVS